MEHIISKLKLWLNANKAYNIKVSRSSFLVQEVKDLHLKAIWTKEQEVVINNIQTDIKSLDVKIDNLEKSMNQKIDQVKIELETKIDDLRDSLITILARNGIK